MQECLNGERKKDKNDYQNEKIETGFGKM